MQKIKCLNPCNVDDRDMEDKHVENDPTFVVTSNPHPRETRQAVKVHQHDNMKYFIDVKEEGGITTNFAAVLSTLVSRNIVEKISTEDAFLCVVVEPETPRQDIEAALNEGMKTQVSIDGMLLFVFEVIDHNLEENMTEINERADKCHEPETHDEFAWDDVNNCKLDPAQGREARKEDMEYFQKMHAYRKVTVQKCNDVTGKMPINVRCIDTNKQDEVNSKYRSRLVAKERKQYNVPDTLSSTLP